MNEIQLMILVFFAIKLSLTASRCINFEIQDEYPHQTDFQCKQSSITDQPKMQMPVANMPTKSSRALNKFIKSKSK